MKDGSSLGLRFGALEDIPFTILWSVWKERNNRVFRGSSTTKEDVLSLVYMRIAKCVSIRREFNSFED